VQNEDRHLARDRRDTAKTHLYLTLNLNVNTALLLGRSVPVSFTASQGIRQQYYWPTIMRTQMRLERDVPVGRLWPSKRPSQQHGIIDVLLAWDFDFEQQS
jgi:hypothetical protein